MRDKERLPDCAALIELSEKAQLLAYSTFRREEVRRVTGRLLRHRHDPEALAEAHVHQVMSGNDLLAGHPNHFFSLHWSIHIVSYRLFDDLWNEKHPDRFEGASAGEHLALKSAWRERVRAMIRDCGQDAAFVMTAEEYTARLIEAGAGEEEAERLVEWMSDVMSEEG